MSLKHKYYRAKFNLAPYLPLPFPVHVDIELAGKCQLACTMCPYGTGEFDKAKQGMMPLDLATAALASAYRGGAKSIKLNFRGEPGLSNSLNPLIYLAKRTYKFTEVAINTNLTSFTAHRINSICDSGLDLIIVSIDGATKETYEKIRVKGDFDKLMRNLRILDRNPNKPKIRLQMVVQEDNQHEVDFFKKRFANLCDEMVFQPVRDRGAGEGSVGERTRCPQPWQRLIVAWDGMVFGCCGNWDNEFPLGQFPEFSLSQIWNGPRMKELREHATKFSSHPCKNCTVGSSYK